MRERYPEECLYIAGPECFYKNGYDHWWSMRKLAEGYGIKVAMPTSTELKLDNNDLRMNAKVIFDDLCIQAGKCTAIIADLDDFRGTEPDGGTIFEIGMMYGKDARIYGYAPQILSISERTPPNSCVHYGPESRNPYHNLPFAPSICCSSRIIAGTFANALDTYLEDLRQARIKEDSVVSEPEITEDSNSVFISSTERYSPDSESIRENIERAFAEVNLKAVFPIYTDKPNHTMYESFKINMQRIRSCKFFLADLIDFNGYEPASDVAFECGYAFSKGKIMKGIMPDIRIMRERIPNIDGFDSQHHIVENFDYPINLMFACSIDDIFQARIDDYDRIVARFANTLRSEIQ